jgi:hypothetical protein
MKVKKKNGRKRIIPLVKSRERVREIRMSYSGDVLYGEWRIDYSAIGDKKLDRGFLADRADEYPYLFLTGPSWVIITPIELTFIRRKSLRRIVRLFKELWATNPPESILNPYDYADALLAHMFLNDEYGVTKMTMTRNDAITEDTKAQKRKYGDKRWYRREIKEVKKKINGRK